MTGNDRVIDIRMEALQRAINTLTMGPAKEQIQWEYDRVRRAIDKSRYRQVPEDA
jgi:hypothetical protein